MKNLLTRNNILITAILILAASLRLYSIEGYMTFLGDEGRDALVLYELLHGDLKFLGPTASVGGFFMGPFYYYLVAPFFFLFGYHPVGPAVLVALLSVATVFLIWKIGKEFFGEFTAFIAAFFYSISSLVITYSHSSWNPNVMPFFTLVTLYILYKAVVSKKWWLFLFTGILYGLDIQLHYTELFIGLVIILYVFLSEAIIQHTLFTARTLVNTIQKGFFIFVGFLIGFSPFLAFEVTHGFPNIRSIIAFIFQSKDTGGDINFFYTVQDVFFRMFGRLLFSFPTSSYENLYNPQLLEIWHLIANIVAISCLGLFLYQLWYIQKKINNKFYLYFLLLLWLCIGIGMFGLYKKQIYDYYFEFLFPVPFLLFGNLIFFLWSQRVIYKIIAVSIFIFALAANFVTSPLRLQPNYQYNQAKIIADAVLEKTDGKPFNFALITGGNSDHAYRYFFKLQGREPVVIENAEKDPKRTSVTDQLLVVCDTLPCSPLGHSLWEVAGFGRAQVSGKWDVSVVQIYKLTPYKSD